MMRLNNIKYPIIEKIDATEILDSRGMPTIEVIISSDNLTTSASVPSGASTGINEVVELRDKDNDRYNGNGVLNAVNNVRNVISKSVIGKSFNQSDFDNMLINLDGSSNKKNLGGNATLGCSLAFARLVALHNNIPLYEYINLLSNKPEMKMPVPMVNIINGGKHADNMLDIQEFMIMPVFGNSFSEAIRASSEIFFNLKKIIKTNNHNTNVGDEGGFAPNINKAEDAIEMILEAVRLSGYYAGKDILLALDAAASEFYSEDKYYLTQLDGKKNEQNSQQMIDLYKNLVHSYPVYSIEDPMSELDIKGFADITKEIGSKIQIVGDDLFTTNPKLINQYASQNICNAVLIKPNQIGTLTETLEAINITHKFGYNAIISHRSGETEDNFIADIAVGTGVGQIKTGSMSRSDRLSKYNRLLKIDYQNKISFNDQQILSKNNKNSML